MSPVAVPAVSEGDDARVVLGRCMATVAGANARLIHAAGFYDALQRKGAK